MLADVDRALRPELEQLIEADRRNADGFLLSAPPAPDDSEAAPAEIPEDSAQVPPAFAGFRPLSLIGQSEHASVFLAERAGPLDTTTRVALKVIRSPAAGAALLRRFEQEHRIIALMDHPNVAHFLGAGALPDGRAYLALEHVPGCPITTLARREKLALRERLFLFTQACLGVEHAHQRGIIHRDLKPSNIIAARSSSGALTVKVIDFGIAKAIDAGKAAGTLTSPGQFVGTLPYMSPEQVRADPGIDTRSDIYSMGAVLYELLTDGPLVDPSAGGPVTLIDTILHASAPPPSARNRAARGDLDTITGAALAKDPARRYASIADLRHDVERYLNGLPIVARRPSLAYLGRKFIARHRLLTIVTFVAVAAIAVAAGREWQVQNQRFDLAVDIARRWFDEIRAMARDADFRSKRGPLVHRLDLASAQLFDQAPGAPGVRRLRADVLVALGDLEHEEGRPAHALVRFREAAAIREALYLQAPQTPDLRSDLSIALVRTGDVLRDLQQDEEGLALYRRALALDEQTFAESPTTPRAITVLAWSYDRLGIYAQYHEGEAAAAALYKKEFDLFHKLIRVERSADAYRGLANVETHFGFLLCQRDPAAARAFLRDAVAHADEAAGIEPDDRLALATRIESRLHLLLSPIAPTDGAEFRGVADETLTQARALAARDPDDTIFLRDLADALGAAGTAALRCGDQRAAVGLFREEIDCARRLLAMHPDDPGDAGRLAFAAGKIGGTAER
jgi:tetratricopeptide (TPR) repeat protein